MRFTLDLLIALGGIWLAIMAFGTLFAIIIKFTHGYWK
jgi:hypothetical protein